MIKTLPIKEKYVIAIYGQYKFPHFTNTTFTASYQVMISCKMEEL
jgi:hypothetical protein